MFLANVQHNSLKLSGKELLTCGSSRANYIFFNFSEEWDGLDRIVVFKTQSEKISILLDENQTTIPIPWECYKTVGDTIFVGAYGMETGGEKQIILPTIWATVGQVVDATDVSDADSPEPTQSVLLDLLETVISLGEDVKTYSEHPNLKKRDNPTQHPIDAIDQLPEALDHKLSPDDYLTSDDILTLLGGNKE